MTTPNTAANGGQILTDERIIALHDSMFPRVLLDTDRIMGNVVAFARAIEADLRAALAAPASAQPASQVAPLLGFLKSPEGKEAIASWRKRNATPATVKTAEEKPLTRCAANRDGDCTHHECPQLRDNEPHATGRHCPIDTSLEDEQ